jgi:hypothetical protein
MTRVVAVAAAGGLVAPGLHTLPVIGVPEPVEPAGLGETEVTAIPPPQ